MASLILDERDQRFVLFEMLGEKIASIYEGANGIQALDLSGRKLPMKKAATS